MDLILSSNSPVVADSLGAAIMGIPLTKAKHILVVEKEGLGTTDLKKVEMNDDWGKFKMQFSMNKTLIDSVSVLLFNSDVLAKTVIDSPATSLIYKVAGYLRNSEEKEVADGMRG